MINSWTSSKKVSPNFNLVDLFLGPPYFVIRESSFIYSSVIIFLDTQFLLIVLLSNP